MARVGKLPGAGISKDTPEVSPRVIIDTTIVVASLLETIVILGGLVWAVTAANSSAVAARIFIVVAVAVISAAAFAFAVARRPRE